jgi:hypothetical protein
MGLDMSYQAIPEACDLIERARHEKGLGEMLCLVPLWFSNGVGPTRRSWPEAELLWRQLCELAGQYPGLAQRNCYLGRCWDKLHYLLSANRRHEPGSEEDTLLDKAVRGAAEIAAHVRAPQGVPVMYVSPAEVELIGVVLEPMTTASLRVHYSPAKMEASGVYKFWADRADESEWRHIDDSFVTFQTFYLDAARHGEGVIVCLD